MRSLGREAIGIKQARTLRNGITITKKRALSDQINGGQKIGKEWFCLGVKIMPRPKRP
jgi:hypothetical protein